MMNIKDLQSLKIPWASQLIKTTI